VKKQVPAAARTLAILDFLAAHPTESFTLSELARELGIGFGSAHALLDAMTSAGYLVRHPSHKTYRLGPSTIAVGHAALESHPIIEVAREEMRRVADELDLECLASVPLGDELVVVARAGRAHPGRPLARVGDRLPLVPPLGTMFVAWSGEEVIERWLARADPTGSPDAELRYRGVLDSARALGYSVGIWADDKSKPIGPKDGDPNVLDLDADAAYPVMYIAASAFDHRGEVALVLNLDGFSAPLPSTQITTLGERLAELARVVTRGVHGNTPTVQAAAGRGGLDPDADEA
jgi:DNA-binding IclR family transcriptional regulator